MKCRILAGYHEFGRTLKEVIPEKPQICLKSPELRYRVKAALNMRSSQLCVLPHRKECVT